MWNANHLVYGLNSGHRVAHWDGTVKNADLISAEDKPLQGVYWIQYGTISVRMLYLEPFNSVQTMLP